VTRAGRCAAVLLLGAAAAARATPLCHDSKGLFTPCPRARDGGIVASPVDHAATAARQQQQERHAREHPEARKRGPGLLGRGKLCRDTRGLFTPCPR